MGKWFGIPDGKHITVHVVSVESNIQIFFEDFYRYNELVQDIVNCIMLPKTRRWLQIRCYLSSCAIEFDILSTGTLARLLNRLGKKLICWLHFLAASPLQL